MVGIRKARINGKMATALHGEHCYQTYGSLGMPYAVPCDQYGNAFGNIERREEQEKVGGIILKEE